MIRFNNCWSNWIFDCSVYKSLNILFDVWYETCGKYVWSSFKDNIFRIFFTFWLKLVFLSKKCCCHVLLFLCKWILLLFLTRGKNRNLRFVMLIVLIVQRFRNNSLRLSLSILVTQMIHQTLKYIVKWIAIRYILTYIVCLPCRKSNQKTDEKSF